MLLDALRDYHLRLLNVANSYKPLDFGGCGLTGSITAEGRIIAINTYHPQHGYVTLSSVPPFPDAQRYDQDAVRRYRRAVAANAGFGMAFFSPIVKREAYLIEDALPFIRLTLEDGVIAESVTFITRRNPNYAIAEVVQHWRFSEPGKHARWTGKFWLQRSAYTQLTEGGIVDMPSVETKISYQRRGIGSCGVKNAVLGYSAFLHGDGIAETEDGGITFLEDGFVYPTISDDFKHGLDSQFCIQIGEDASSRHAGDAIDYLVPLADAWRKLWQSIPDDLMLRRGLCYGLSCCVPISDEATCIITDHMLLPLAWNRDAYFIALALMKWHELGREQVAKHIAWMFDVAERVDNLWGRSYLANGKIKDHGYQLDQQLYPLLELLDYVAYTRDDALLKRYASGIDNILRALLEKKHPEKWLFSTAETPADDPIAYAYPLSSHILLWHVCNCCARQELDSAIDFADWAQQTRESIQQYFVTSLDNKSIFAYATDGAGRYHLYHDANDMPLALAVAWGFTSVEDEIWHNTIDFAFSEANGGFFDGVLGSVHTPAPWALGDAQEIIIAQALGDAGRETAARKRLATKAAQWDGALSEAYHAQTGDVVSRHWFAWTNAMLGFIDL